MQAAKKEHARLLRQKAQNEQQLRVFQGELSELKKTKVRLMKQMKEEAAKSKQQEAQRNKQIAQLKKESRLRQMTIKNLEMEKRQRDIVLKRKQEEVRITILKCESDNAFFNFFFLGDIEKQIVP